MKTNLEANRSVRVEEDALGNVEVPLEHLWGAQTERSRHNFPIGVDRYCWGRPVIRALGILKKCAALANEELGQLPRQKVELIVRAAQEVIRMNRAAFFRLLRAVATAESSIRRGVEMATSASEYLPLRKFHSTRWRPRQLSGVNALRPARLKQGEGWHPSCKPAKAI